jgi:hypothetical protein
MNICDDGPYILMARTLASTGRIAYNGWASPLIGWQLYLGAAFIKLFGFSYTAVRSSTLLVAMALAFVLQRTLVRASISERNATLGTLALVLSPLYLMLSVTYMTDIPGLFAIVLCLYGCLRALQASTPRAIIAWLGLAVVTNTLCGTARQIAWLGTLVMVPSTLWLLRDPPRRNLPEPRRILLAGAAATFAGALFIFACMQWLKRQPYVIPMPLLNSRYSLAHGIGQLSFLLLDVPFLLLPIFILFLPALRKSRPRIILLLSAALLGFIFLATYPSHLRGAFRHLLEPSGEQMGSWVGVHGFIEILSLNGTKPLFLNTEAQVFLTLISYSALISLVISVLHSKSLHTKWLHSQPTPPDTGFRNDITWKQLAILFVPFSLAYILLLLSAAATTCYLFDRYALGLLLLALICLLRYYQERIRPQLPLTSLFLIALMTIYGIALTHDTFALARARVTLAAELAANGVPPTSVDNGWDYNVDVELQHANHINDSRILVPANAYVPQSRLPGGCHMQWYERFPHIRPLYGVSFTPGLCNGPAPFAPVQYSRWPYTPGTLYVIRYSSTR